MLRWMQVNLAVITFISTSLTALAGMLIAGSIRVSEVAHDISSLRADHADTKLALSGVHADMVSVDGRLNSGVTLIGAMQRACEARDAQLEQRIAVLEAKFAFVIDRMGTPGPLGTKR